MTSTISGKNPLLARLTTAVHRCLEGAVRRTTPEALDVGAGAEHALRVGLLKIEEDSQTALASVLAKVDGIDVFHDGAMWCGSMGWPVFMAGLPKYVVLRATEVGAARAAKEIVELASTNGAEVHDYLALAGVAVKGPVSLAHDLELVPFEEVPRNSATDHLTGTSFISLPPNVASTGRTRTPPTAVVRHVRWAAPLVVPRGSPQSNPTNSEYLLDAALALVLVGPSVVLERAWWTWLPPAVPFFDRQGSSTNPVHEIHYPHYRLEPFELDDAGADLARRFLTADNEVRTRLRLPIRRLRQSLMRQSQVDQAVELGIALEALLLEEGLRDNLVETGRNRAAVLLGGTQTERETVMSLYDACYDMRSRAVHSGQLATDEKRKVKHTGKLDGEEVLKLGHRLCRDLIVRIVENGGFPDWNKVFPPARQVALTHELRPKGSAS